MLSSFIKTSNPNNGAIPKFKTKKMITSDGMRKDHLLPPSSLIWFLNCLWQPVVDLGSTCCRGRDVDLPLPIDLRHLFRPEHHHAGADPFHVMVYLDDLAGAR